MTLFAWFLFVACVLVVFALGMTLFNLAFYRRAAEYVASGSDAPLISVCIPARNESENLEACVRGLLAQTHGEVEVIVYNDHSTDDTGVILARLCEGDQRVHAAAVESLPPDWNGKQFACDRMGRQANGQWLLFTDADVRFEPDCVRLTLAAAQRLSADLVSTFPRQVTRTLGESLIIPLIHFILLSFLPFIRMRRTADPAASAGCGQFLFVRTAAYRSVGGHGEFRDSMHDGIKMPRTLRKAGFRTDLVDGTSIVSCRMYQGFAATWRGFAKNAYEGLGSVGLLLFVTAFNLLAYVLPPVTLAWWGGNALVAGATPAAPDASMWLALIATFIALGHRFLLAARFRQSVFAAALHPVGILLMTAIQWWSLYLTLTGKRSWRGRTHQAAPAA